MTDHLRYRGDQTRYDPGTCYGPDRYGALYRAIDAEFDGKHTTLSLLPVPHAEAPDRFGHITRGHVERIRIAELFGGVADLDKPEAPSRDECEPTFFACTCGRTFPAEFLYQVHVKAYATYNETCPKVKNDRRY